MYISGVPPSVAQRMANWKEMPDIDLPDALAVLPKRGRSRIHGAAMLELLSHMPPLAGEEPGFFRSEMDIFPGRTG